MGEMSAELHRHAQEDTPKDVEVPQGYVGLVVWALGKFGGWIVIAGAAIWASKVLYHDMRMDRLTYEKDRRIYEDLRRADDEVRRETARALNEIAGTLHSIERRMRIIPVVPEVGAGGEGE